VFWEVVMNRRDFIKGLGVVLAGMAGGKWVSQVLGAQTAKPNILMILVDDLGYGDLSCYGAKDLVTPNLDRLMAQGMRLDNFYANCPVCSPTRASLLTGRYPDLVGVPGVIRTRIKNSWGYLFEKAVMLPEVLKKAGYHTGIVGKWHLGLESPNLPNERGFDHFHGFLGDMMNDYYTHLRQGHNYMRLNDKQVDPEGHATDVFTKWASDYIEERSKTGQPFFLYLAYNAPHDPIQPPAEWLERVKNRQKGIDEKRAKIAALIEHLDEGIGKVLMTLKKTGADRNTLVIFTSDNGGSLRFGANNGPLRGGKGEMYEGGIKEAMCAVWPGRIEAGSRSSRVALTMDLYATMCEAGQAKFKHEIDGRSILPTLLGKDQPKEDRFIFWVRREGGYYGGRDYYAVRYHNWKLLQNTPFEPLVFYDLKNDPLEQKPLTKKHRMYNKLFTALRDHICRTGAVPWQKYPVDIEKVR